MQITMWHILPFYNHVLYKVDLYKHDHVYYTPAMEHMLLFYNHVLHTYCTFIQVHRYPHIPTNTKKPNMGHYQLITSSHLWTWLIQLIQDEWHIYVSQNYHWLVITPLVQIMLVTCSVPGHYLNQWWLIVNWTLRKYSSEICIKIQQFYLKKLIQKCHL